MKKIIIAGRDLVNKLIFQHQMKKNPFPIKLIVGASGDRYPGWISTDKAFFDITNEDHWRKYFDYKQILKGYEEKPKFGYKEEIIDGVKTQVPFLEPLKMIDVNKPMEVISRILAEHVVEHLNELDAKQFFRLAYQHLTIGGRIRIAVPDMLHPNQDYINYVRDPIHNHRSEWTDKKLYWALKNAGFENVQIKEGYNEAGFFNISTWYNIDGFVRRSFWHDHRNMTMEEGFLWSSLIVDGIKEPIKTKKGSKIIV